MLGIRDRVLKTQRQDQPDRARFHQLQRPRPDRRTPSSAGRRRSPTSWRRCSSAAAATASSSRRPTCRAPTRISSATSFPSCSGAGFFTRTTRARRCARISASRPSAGAWKISARGGGITRIHHALASIHCERADLLGHCRRRPRGRGQRRHVRRLETHRAIALARRREGRSAGHARARSIAPA